MPVADREYDGVVHVITDNQYLRDYHRSAEQQQQQTVGVVVENAAPPAAAKPEVHQTLHPMAPPSLQPRQLQQQPNVGDAVFVSVSSRKYRKLQDVLRGRSVLEKWIIAFVAVLCCTGLVLAVMKIAGGFKGSRGVKKNSTCTSEECLISADSILRSINVEVEPCDDFYEFACGNWHYNHHRESDKPNNWFFERSQVVSKEVTKIFEERDREGDLNSIKQARRLYRTCLDTDTLDELGYRPLFHFMDKVGLPRIFPDFTTTTYNNGSVFNVARTLGLTERFMGVDLMVQISLELNPKTNRTILTLGPVNVFVSPLPEPLIDYRRGGVGRQQPHHVSSIDDAINSQIVLAKVEYMIMVITYLFPGEFLNTTSLATFCFKILIMEANLKKPLDVDKKPQEFTVASLREYMYSNTSDLLEEKLFDWQSFIDHFTTESNYTWSMNDVVLVRNPEFFLELQWRLIDTPMEEIQQFLWWKVVETIIPHTTSDMADLKLALNDAVIPMTIRMTRSEFCTAVVRSFVKNPIAYEFYVRDDLKATTAKIRNMIKQLQDSFTDMIRESDWTDEATKHVTTEKADAIKVRVGYPKIFDTPDVLDKHYDYLKIEDHQYLQSMLNMRAYQVQDLLGQVDQPITPDIFEDSIQSDPLEVNAFYSRLDNSINIPAGILQIPFFNKGVDVVNYGAIGSILGHEISHGFDIEGKNYNIHGQKTSQWSQYTEREYLIRALCFVRQYDQFMLNSNVRLNGTHTLAENMADNVGLKQTWRAYKSHNIDEESHLAGLTEYSNDQLFFLSYANVWCQKPNNKKDDKIDHLINDEHSPSGVRVIGALRNSPEFSEVWKCPAGSPMNPSKKCSMW